MPDKSSTIYFGGGCFWCTEAVFELFKGKGVVEVLPGYAGGTAKNPTYEEVCTGATGHAEVLKIVFLEEKISLDTLLEAFFAMHDPTSLNKQGNDVGTQYRSIILCTSSEQKEIVEKYIKKVLKDYQNKIVTEVVMLQEFYPAEDYHISYYKKHSGDMYCSLVISPKIEKIRKKFEV